jgi:CRP/FNR family nitrogen fixation transcriptional regulator
MAPQISATQSRTDQGLLANIFLRQDTSAQPHMGSVQNVSQDREIFAEGDHADYFFKIMSGVVRTCKFLADGRRQIDAFYVAGDIFGFEAGEDYQLSAEAVTDCTLIVYRRNKIDALAGSDKIASHELLNFAMRGMARAQAHSLLLGRRSAMEKVAGFLLTWAQKGANHKTVTLAMTRQDIGDYLGLTIETVSRTLSQMERENVIDLPTARQICVRNLERLEDIAA